MRTFRLLVSAVMVFGLLGCSETVNETIVDEYPSPLYTTPLSFEKSVFEHRRDELLNDLPSGSFVFVTTAGIQPRNGTVSYEFHPMPTFYYLTGFDEPNAVAIIREDPLHPGTSMLVMFVEERTSVEEQWMGPVHGIAGAIATFGADSAYEIGEWTTGLVSSFTSGSYSSIYANLADNGGIRQTFQDLTDLSTQALDVRPFVDNLRLVKSADEIERIRRASRISVQAFGEAIQRVRPSLFEFEVEAIFDLVFRINGCSGVAFPSIVASGPNINTLHYDDNVRMMQEGDLVMIDIGAEYEFYASDVTRTLPVNGTFSHEQGVIYDIVKKAYDTVLVSMAPGVAYVSLLSMQRELIIDEMLKAGIITGTRNEIISSGRYRQYIPAGLAHSLGLDVHDPWYPYSERVLLENMVLAVEPHIYLHPNDMSVAAAYRGVCARIENDVRITTTGTETLSDELPYDRASLERLMKDQ